MNSRLRIHAVTALVLSIALAATAVACLDESSEMAACVPDHGAAESVPRMWVDATLDAVRRDFPAPTVHARNLWHLSAAMWDAHAAFGQDARPFFDHGVVAEDAEDPAVAESIAISFAAYDLLTWRYEPAVGAEESLAQFDEVMASLCLDPGADPAEGSPAWVGRQIAAHAIEVGLDDGSAEADGYEDPSYEPANPPLVVDSAEIAMADPNRWQPLELARRITQNGQLEDENIQTYIGSNWGWVDSFSLPDPDADGITIDVPPPPLLGETTDDYVASAIELIEYSDLLGGETGADRIDIGPGSRGNAELGETVGPGHSENPVTGAPYEPNLVPHGDYGRAIAEYWADGPDSETPPGHWNTIAILVSDTLPPDDLRWAGTGPVLTRHDWDLRLFFTLNAAMHDAAVAVWGAKRAFDYARPISIIRHLGSEDLLPMTPGLVEVVTDESVESGRHRSSIPIGTTVVRSWMGPVMDPESQLAGVDWRPVAEWLPYQRATFVSPAFAAYVSGHSGFSRAAADLLTDATGSRYFPGGIWTHFVPAGSLLHEEGPSVDVELQWATYQDAADEAGESRRYGGIHIAADDIAGRRMGAEVAELVWAKAQPYFG